MHHKHLHITISQDKSPASGGSFSVRKKPTTNINMKLRIEIQKQYYDITRDNPALQILEPGQADWKEFAFDMADAVKRALKDQT